MDNSSLTNPVPHEPSVGEIRTSLELYVRGPRGVSEVVPITLVSLDYRLPDGHTIRFSRDDGIVSFKDLCASCLIYKDGVTKTSGRLEVGNSIEVGSFRLTLWDSAAPLPFLKGCTAPYSNDIWLLPKGNHAVGRPGKRSNTVSLDHPTVSREHARILGRDDGSYTVLAEASTNRVYLRGAPVAAGKTEELRHGDLLEVGDLIFRFHQPHGSGEQAASRACLDVSSFGELTVSLAGSAIPEKTWRTQYVKWLFAHLAFSWDRPLVIEGLVNELWPEAESDAEKASANFKFTLSTLAQILRSHLPESQQASEPILRSSSTLQLNPDLLDRHDAVALQRLVRSIGLADHHDESWGQEAVAAVLGYGGPFLEDCSLHWAVEARRTLQAQVLELSRALLEAMASKARWEGVAQVARHTLTIDPLSQWACLYLMRASRYTGGREEALRLFEQSRTLWETRIGASPEAELLEEQQVLLSLES